MVKTYTVTPLRQFQLNLVCMAHTLYFTAVLLWLPVFWYECMYNRNTSLYIVTSFHNQTCNTTTINSIKSRHILSSVVNYF